MEVVSTGTGPALPFSPGLKVNGFVFLSGQGGFVPATGKPAGENIEEQASRP